MTFIWPVKENTQVFSLCDEFDKNIKNVKNGFKSLIYTLSGSGIESDIKQKQVEALSLDESMKPETH